MSVASSLDHLLSGFGSVLLDLVGKAIHFILDEVSAKAEQEGAELLVREALRLGVSLPPEIAAQLVSVVIAHVREHI